MAKKKTTTAAVKKTSIECVSVRPAACPRCSCTDRGKKRSVIKREIKGTLQPGNVEYSLVQWSYCDCSNCGQRYRFIEYLNPKSRP